MPYSYTSLGLGNLPASGLLIVGRDDHQSNATVSELALASASTEIALPQPNSLADRAKEEIRLPHRACLEMLYLPSKLCTSSVL